jgi:hypothetical protein
VVQVAEKKSFVLYCDYKKHFSLLSSEDQGRLLMAIFDYVESGAEPQLEAMPLMAFSFIRAQLDRDIEKYAETCRKRREAGRQGGRPPKPKDNEENQTEAKKANGFSENQTEAKKPDNDTVTVNGNVNVTGNEIINNRGNSGESPRKKTTRFVPPTVKDVQAYCNERGNRVNPEAFVDFYSAKGWMVGKNKMKDWKAAVRTWEKSENRPTGNTRPVQPKPYSNPALDYARQLEYEEQMQRKGMSQ